MLCSCQYLSDSANQVLHMGVCQTLLAVWQMGAYQTQLAVWHMGECQTMLAVWKIFRPKADSRQNGRVTSSVDFTF